MTGDTSDISFIVEFGWYDWVWFVSPNYKKNRMGVKHLGCYLGPATNVGDAMCGTVITSKSTRLDRTSIIPLSLEDHNFESVTAQKEEFTEALRLKLKDRAAAMKAGKEAGELDEEFAIYDDWTPQH